VKQFQKNNPTDPLRHLASHWLWPLGGLIFALKVLFALRLELYSDEIFYWFESTRPALAYSDLPFMSSLLAGLGTAVLGDTPFAVRLPFFLLGCSLPAVLYWTALPLVGKAEAREAALLSLCLPLASSLGLLAVPDVPLVFSGLLAVGFFIRARATDSLIHWVATGVVVAFGLSTHYRFSLFPVGAVLLLLWDSSSRQLWRNPRTLIAFAVAAVGLVPVILFNASHQMGSLAFYLVDRHPWEFRPAGLLHLFEQALLSTPLLYGLLLATGLGLLRSAEPNARLVALIAALHIVLYATLAPFSDPNSTTLHWPLAGYIPLLIYAPAALRRLTSSFAIGRRTTALLFSLGYLGSLTALTVVGSQSLHTQLQPILGTGVLSTKMAGWAQFAADTRLVVKAHFEEPPLIVTDNYYTAAQLAFAKLTEPHSIYTLDTEKAVRDGRALQLSLWGMDTAALIDNTNSPALLVTEDSTLNFGQKRAILQQACTLSEGLKFLQQINLVGGAKRFSFYAIHIAAPAQPIECSIPARGWIDSPAAGERVAENFTVSGWAFAEGNKVELIRVLIDGVSVPYSGARTERADLDIVEGAKQDLQFPNLGYRYTIGTDNLSSGAHTLQLELVSGSGEVSASLFTEFYFSPIPTPN
jgi:hypothetical protein